MTKHRAKYKGNLADGSMRLYTSSGIMDYEAGQYSIS